MKAMWMDALRHLRSQRRATAVTVLGLMPDSAANWPLPPERGPLRS